MTRTVVIAIAGRIGSGKSSISIILASELGWKRASFGDFVRSVAAKRGQEPCREVLQEIGAELEANDPSAFCKEVLASAGWRSGEAVVIDGIRHESILAILKKLVAPLPVFFVYLEAEDDTRKARVAQRERIEADLLPTVELHSTERDVISRLPDLADLRLLNETNTAQGLVRSIRERLQVID
jgi:cytidylate kinase